MNFMHHTKTHLMSMKKEDLVKIILDHQKKMKGGSIFESKTSSQLKKLVQAFKEHAKTLPMKQSSIQHVEQIESLADEILNAPDLRQKFLLESKNFTQVAKRTNFNISKHI